MLSESYINNQFHSYPEDEIMWKIKNKEAVSPVIGVILMVAITVILAAVVYIWVTSLMPSVKETPAISGTTSASGNGFTVNIISITGGGVTSITVKALKYVLRDSAGNVKDSGDVEDIYGTYSTVGTPPKEGVKFQDNTYAAGTSPGAMGASDIFYIKDTSHNGVAESGYKLELIHNSGSVCGSFVL